MKLEIYQTWQGYEIAKPYPKNKDLHMFLTGVYAGRAKWEDDYIRARHYKTRKAAEAVAKKIESGEIK